tara:strand:- start:181 stop:723 length:543 start_codon:yes stop_codon:yes gene_type:complete
MFATLIEESGLRDYIDTNAQDPWHDTMFRGYVFMSPKQKGEFGERFVSQYMQQDGFESLVERAATSTAGYDRVIDGILTEIKFSLATRDKKGGVKKDSFIINHISRDKEWERLIFFGINFDECDARLVWFTKESFIDNLESDECLFAHQQGGKSIENDDFICTKVSTLIAQPWVRKIDEW